MLDLEFCSADASRISETISRLTRFAGPGFGVQLRADQTELCSLILALPTKPAQVILCGAEQPNLREVIERLRAAGIAVLREVTTLDEARNAVAFGVSGLSLKGHEAGGRVGADTSFVLVQNWRNYSGKNGVILPFWVRGGVGPNTAAACLTAGARGVVLDSQVLLARESTLSVVARRRVAGLDGSETSLFGSTLGEQYRVYDRPDSPAAQALASVEEELHAANLPPEAKLLAWRDSVRSRVATDPSDGAWLIGQDVASAERLATRGVTVAGIIQRICVQAQNQFEAAQRVQHISEDGPLAKSHGTRYPILQGPMTRVSDTCAFAAAVAEGGALPFLALALLRKNETEQLLAETKSKLGKRPWGVGILGFVPNEIRAEQVEAIRIHKPPFALIAGGRPDQAKQLEAQGIPTYLHVPSPGLLRMFLKDGARRFIFEGQECGGHIGPRASFALWEPVVEILAEHAKGKAAEELHVVFAGGIHDNLSARMVAALSAGLAEKGVKVGVLVGTAYLFTQEAVETKAITARFQQEALKCGETVLLESGPGHSIRCIPTPYAETFEAEKTRLQTEGRSPLEVGIALERMNLGRLRIASKGVDRTTSGGNGTSLTAVPEDEQFRRGMYMIGQIAALREKVTTIAQLHTDICGKDATAKTATSQDHNTESSIINHQSAIPNAPPPCDVAIVGLSCFYPKAVGLWRYWENILAKVNAVIEIPPTHWDWRPFYDPDVRTPDKIVSKWGGFMDDVTFDPLKYGITPKSIPCIEPLQLLLLEAVNQALGDAGYLERPFPRERTCAILGIGGGGMPLSVAYGFRACIPLMDSIPNVPTQSSEILELGKGILPEWTEDSFPGILLNVAAGRVANRFDLGGPNMAIDAACGSSLAALYAGVRELNDGTSDVAIVMGGDAVQTPYAYVAFSKTYALSPRGRCRPFDAAADGIALAEGVGVAVLKRLADAERDGDRIYAVVKGVGSSSDGRDKGLTAPRAEGQLRALRRAYAQARVSPARVGLVEAHGTGTVVGDQTEARAIGQLFRDAGGAAQSCAIGSVKSMIGHSKCAAGLAGLIKAAFSLHNKVLPPTLVEAPNPKANLDGGPLYLNTEPRPWIHGAEHPRTAGVSAFGFGGTNFHTVLEEYTGDFLNRPNSALRNWPAELLVWRRSDASTLLADVKKCRDALTTGAQPALAELAAAVWQSSKNGVVTGAKAANGQPEAQTSSPILAVVATSLNDLRDKLDVVLNALPKESSLHDPRGIYFATKPSSDAKVAFLFPGQGSQYPDMLAQQAMAFAEVREVLDRAERALVGQLDRPLGKFIYPPSPFTPDQEAANKKALQRTEVAQPAVGAASLGMFRLLTALGIEPAFLAGHSYGEYAALAAGGALSEDDLIRLSHRRGVVIRDSAAASPGGMLAADATPEPVHQALMGLSEVWVANHNSPHQTVLAGTETGLKAAAEKLQASGIRSQRIPVACGFHSPLIALAKEPLAKALTEVRFTSPLKPVFSNTTAAPHSSVPAEIVKQLAEHLVSPVKFADEIAAIYDAGARVFVEVGPQGVLTGLTAQILEGKPHLAVASDAKGRPGLVQLTHLLGQLCTVGVPVQLDRLFEGRGLQPFDLTKLSADTGKPKHPATVWVVNGVRSRPLNGPEPQLLGQALPDSVMARATYPAPTDEPMPSGIGRVSQSAEPMPSGIGRVSQSAEPVPSGIGRVSQSAEPVPSGIGRSSQSTEPVQQGTRGTTQQMPGELPQKLQAHTNGVRTTSTETTRPRNGAEAGLQQSKRTEQTKTPTAQVFSVPATPRGTMNNDTALHAAPATNGQQHTQPAPDSAAAVMLRFQEVMARFLDTQRSVMLSFLGSGQAGTTSTNGHAASLPGENGHSNGNGNGHTSASFPLAPAVTNRIVMPEPAARPVPPPTISTNGHTTPATPEVTRAETSSKQEAPVAVSASKPASGPLDSETLQARLLDLVSERTGYPKEALSIDLDLEADLGVDSIKRVEILGAMAESLGNGVDGQQPNLEMEKLSVIKTIRGIVDYVMSAMGEAAPQPSENGQAKAISAARNGEAHPGARAGEVQRLVVRLIDAPPLIRPRLTQPSGVILVTDDRQGTAQELADRLAELDVKTALIRMAQPGEAVGDSFAADLTDPAAVNELLARIHEKCGPVSGLIHLLPLAEPPEGETPAERMRREVKSLYLLTRGLEGEIREAGKKGSALLFAVTAMGGQMGFGGELPVEFFPGHGGVAGFTKSLGYEWPEVTVRVVDVDGETPAIHVAEMLLTELGDPDGPFEIGRSGDRRLTWQVDPGPLAKDHAAIELGPDDTVLITGGARGITAKVALELASRFKPRLVLVGSSSAPAPESADTVGLTTAAEIKAALLKRQPEAKPATIESTYRRLLKDREILANLAQIREAGSVVDYRSVDVRDSAAFGALIDELKSAGKLVGVIHGAGVIEDKLLKDKTPESFERVFGTKVDSALTLMSKLDPEKLKFFALFASITSRYGNRGQSDYASANEVLSKMACDLDRKWPGRVVSIAWGPWSEVGMVADLEKHLVARGLKLIEPAIGAGFAVDEVISGAKGEPEVLVAGGTERPARQARSGKNDAHHGDKLVPNASQD
jgi:acyl transferase domain-containing protein/NAD(P)H-dependent flavin oxidoreductase YrpB (nitropropane dioxygenase family)/NAD(P)-dependent dehydrogenase (short-subunit alcohol dehydrogenase family)/acyl carrier protein